MNQLPRPVLPFVQFPQILRAHGFAVAPEQTSAFIEAISLLGPQDISDIRNAGLAMLAIPRERQSEYDALFRAFFMGQTASAPTSSDEDGEELEAFDERDGEHEVEVTEEEQNVGGEASLTEALTRREFENVSDDETLRLFARRARTALPARRSHRRVSSRNGTAFDMRRSLHEAVKRDGEVFDLKQTRRKQRQRPICLLIDVSGSMEANSEPSMRFAHALKQAGDRVEVFTFGTRLTRITRALSDKNETRALDKVGGLVADFDGGTRIGDALNALLSVPRFAGALRGASVLILSDGLERGDPSIMVDAIKRISRAAWRLDWLSPLAGDTNYVPRTEALSAALPWLDSLENGGSVSALCEHVLALQNNSKFQSRRIAA